jgi:hypothetical protein
MFKHKDNKIARICLLVKICSDYVRQYWCPTESTSLDEEPPIGDKHPILCLREIFNDIKLIYIELICSKVRIEPSLICLMEI